VNVQEAFIVGDFQLLLLQPAVWLNVSEYILAVFMLILTWLSRFMLVLCLNSQSAFVETRLTEKLWLLSNNASIFYSSF